ncbi:MAG: hypothetical protein OEZ36_04430 [Spirochaetota bacterium]|nr:hypothetical protein [Spirochaetota bacterium]
MRKSLISLALVFGVICLSFTISFSSEREMIFDNGEVILSFAPDGFITTLLKKTPDPKNYFNRYKYLVKFHRVKPQPAYVQQVSSEDGWLSELRVLPKENMDKLIEDIPGMYPPNKYARLTEVRLINVKKFKVLNWKHQIGKTRLQHFLVLGRKHNYLFISSPYGETESILALIRKMSYK